jgi:uncharacterized delta-60 repeat protein
MNTHFLGRRRRRTRGRLLHVEALEARRVLSTMLDTSFGEEGLVSTDFTEGGNDEGRAIILQEDGGMLVVGVAGAIRESDKPVDTGGGGGGGGGGGRPTRSSSVSLLAEPSLALPSTKGGGRGGGGGGGGSGGSRGGEPSEMGEPDDPLIPDFAIARYDSTGALDTAFGELDPLDPSELLRTGKVVTNFGGDEALTYDEANGVLMLPGGGFVVVGATRTELEGPNDFALAFYSSNGQLENLVTTDFGGDDFARKAALQTVNSETMLVVVGTSALPDSPTDADFAIARYHLSGQLDESFGAGGLQAIDFFEGKDDGVEVLISGANQEKIIVVGHIKDSSRVEPQLFGGPLDFGVAQLDSSGQLDTTFGALDPMDPEQELRTGKVSTDLASTIYPEEVDLYSTDESWAAVLQGENIVVAGRYGAKGVSDFALVRYTAMGELDPTFAANGALHTDILGGPDSAYDVTLRQSGEIVVVGRATLNAKFTWAMAIYGQDGEHQETLTTPYFAGEEGGPDQANSVAEDRQGRLVVAGWVSMPGTMVDFGLARYQVGSAAPAPTMIVPQAVDEVYTELALAEEVPWSKPGFRGPGPAPWAPPHRGNSTPAPANLLTEVERSIPRGSAQKLKGTPVGGEQLLDQELLLMLH